MCIYFNISNIKYIKKDCYFYKVLIKESEEYFTPFQREKVCFNTTYFSDIGLAFKEDFNIFTWGGSIVKGSIGKHMFHCYKSLRKAKRLARTLYGCMKPIIVKAVVPQGSIIIKGDKKEIASNRIIYEPVFYK